MESRQVHSGLGQQRRQAGNEVQRLEDDMGYAIPIRHLEWFACAGFLGLHDELL